MDLGLSVFQWGCHEGGYEWRVESGDETLKQIRSAKAKGKKYSRRPVELVPLKNEAKVMVPIWINSGNLKSVTAV